MAKGRKNFIKSFFYKIGKYFVEVFKQGRRVRWPNREVLVKTSIIVVTFSAFFAFYLGFCNMIILWMFRQIGLNI